MFEIGQLMDDQYLVLEKHRGRIWTTYIAFDLMSENVFAIKAPCSDSPLLSADRLNERARAWIDLGQADELVTAFMLKELEDIPHLFIEYIDGPTLGDIICSRHGKPLSITQIVGLARQILKGMKSLHGARLLTGGGVTHGNLEPRNIFTTAGKVKISDMGLAGAFEFPGGAQNADLLTRYMPCLAPERMDDPAAETREADIYSFGAVMYELTTGTSPIVLKSPGDPLAGYVASEPAAPRTRNGNCPRWLEETILKCMAREPENRFQSFESIESFVNEMHQTIEGLEDSEPGEPQDRRASRVARARGMAKKESARLNHYYLGVEHMTLGILSEEEAVVLDTLGEKITVEQLREKVLEELPKGEGPWHWDGMVKTPRYRRIMKLARQVKREYSDERMLPQHIFLAILLEGQNAAVRALKKLDVDISSSTKKLRRYLGRRRPSIFVTDADAATAPFAHKLSCVADDPYFAPFLGREAELIRAQDLILSGKKGIILVGRSGVGKTALVQQMGCAISDTVADSKLDFGSIYRLRPAALLASDSDGETIIDNLTHTIDELLKTKSMLFIEDLPVLLDISAKVPPKTIGEILEDAVMSQGLLLISTATPEGYAAFEKESDSLARRLEAINLHEPSDDETLGILNHVKEAFEVDHSAFITEDAIQAASRLSSDFDQSRALPGAALELLDRACTIAGLAEYSAGASPRTVLVSKGHVQLAVGQAFQTKDSRRPTNPEAYI